jgi:hypothetical protein
MKKVKRAFVVGGRGSGQTVMTEDRRHRPRAYEHYSRSPRILMPLIFKVLKEGNAKPLRDHLRSKPALSDEDWEDIAWLIDTLLARTPGRPHTKGAVWDAEWWIAWQIEMIFKPKWKADDTRKRKHVPKDDTEAEIKRLIPLAEAQYPEAKGKIDSEHIIGSMLKGGSKRLRKN